MSILAAMGLARLTQKVFANVFTRAIFLILFITLITTSAWHYNSGVFAYYENPHNHARLHPDELAGILWMRDNLSPDSFIITTLNNRHSEWVRALTPFLWQPLSENDEFLINPVGDRSDSPTYNKLKYVAFFTNTEEVKGKFIDNPDKFPLVYSNNVMAIYNVPPRKK